MASPSKVSFTPPEPKDFISVLGLDLKKPIDNMPLEEISREFETVARGLQYIRTHDVFQRAQALHMAMQESRSEITKVLDGFTKVFSFSHEETVARITANIFLDQENQVDRVILKDLESKLQAASRISSTPALKQNTHVDVKKLEGEMTELLGRLQKKESERDLLTAQIRELNDKLHKGKGDKVRIKQKIAQHQKAREPINREVLLLSNSKKQLDVRLIAGKKDALLLGDVCAVSEISNSYMTALQIEVAEFKSNIAKRQEKVDTIQAELKQDFLRSEMGPYTVKLEERQNLLRSALKKNIHLKA